MNYPWLKENPDIDPDAEVNYPVPAETDDKRPRYFKLLYFN